MVAEACGEASAFDEMAGIRLPIRQTTSMLEPPGEGQAFARCEAACRFTLAEGILLDEAARSGLLQRSRFVK
jgi:hypothetical protein